MVDFPYLCQVHVSIFEGTQNIWHNPIWDDPLNLSVLISETCVHDDVWSLELIKVYIITLYIYIYTPKIIQTHIYIYIYTLYIYISWYDTWWQWRRWWWKWRLAAALWKEPSAGAFGQKTSSNAHGCFYPYSAILLVLYMYIENITYTCIGIYTTYIYL